MFTGDALKKYGLLALLSLLDITILFFVTSALASMPPFPDQILLVSGFTLSALSALMIFFRGSSDADREKAVFLTLISLGVKMLFSFVLALLFILVLKNRSTASLLLFFVLYLEFTFFVIFTILSVLKKKSV